MASKAAKPTAKRKTAGKPPVKPAVTPADPKPKTVAQTSAKPKAEPRASAPKKAPAAKKAPAPKKSAKPSPKIAESKKAQAAVLQADLKALETRLKRADTVTRNSVRALETIVSALDARTKKSTTTQKGALTRHVNALSARLDEQLAHTRTSVRKELKTALSKGGLDILEDAIARSSARIDAAEMAQADAIAKINRHLADMARAVDARIEQEARDRARDIAGVEERLAEARTEVDARIDTVERDSADALTRVGDQVSRIHDKLSSQRQSDTDVVTEKVNELALQTQAEFEAYQAKLEARIGQLEHRHAAIDTDALTGVAEASAERLRHQLTQQIAQMQLRIEELERDAATLSMNAAVAAQGEPAAAPFVTEPTPARLSAVPEPVAADANPYAAALEPVPETDAAAEPDRPSHIPVEFDPSAYAAQSPVQSPAPPQSASVIAYPTPQAAPAARAMVAPPALSTPQSAPPPMPVNAPHMQPAQVQPAPVQPAPPQPVTAQPPVFDPVEPDFDPAPLPGIPYANPAYAEPSDSPKAVRIAGGEAKPKRDFKLPVSPRNLRLGLLMAGVSVAAIFTAKTLLGGEPAPNPGAAQLQPMLDAGANDAMIEMPSISGGTAPGANGFPAPGSTSAEFTLVDPSEATTEPIGQYQEATRVTIDADSMDTLEKAVRSGNPVAQFQMGLAQIEAGDMSRGAKLMQMAADADQPAALYRLAKLYETGEGVEANDTTARRLIERAARGGNRIAMHDLALYHTEGRGGLETDMLTARSWFEQAALRGVVDSQFNLAVLSESADSGLQPDLEDAYFWYSVASAQGDQYAIGRRDALGARLDPELRDRVAARLAAFEPRPIDEAANGIFTDQPWMKRRPASAARDDVRNVQSLLARLGYEVGGADGLMGARTRTAIMAFEEANGMPKTGRVNDALVDRLELAAGV